jgi:hypothetical protein
MRNDGCGLLAADSIEVAGSHEFTNATLKHFASNKILVKHLRAFTHGRKELISSKRKGNHGQRKEI